MSVRGPRLEFAVGAFLVLALASLLVLAIASTNKKFGFGSSSYELTARFTNPVSTGLASRYRRNEGNPARSRNTASNRGAQFTGPVRP